MTTRLQTVGERVTARTSNVIPFPKPRKRRGDVFRTEAAQEMFRARWNAARARGGLSEKH